MHKLKKLMLEIKTNTKLQFLTAIIFIFALNILNSKDEDKDFEYFFKKLYENKLEELNHPVLSLKLRTPDIHLPTPFENKYLPKGYSYELYYGFFRKSEEYYYDDFFYHSHEYAFGGNTTSKLDPNADFGRLLDSWRWGLGWQDGFGYNVNNVEIFLIHKGSFNWTNIMLNFYEEDRAIRTFTNGLRFGQNFGSGIMVKVAGPFHVSMTYEKSLIHRRYVFGQHLVSWGLENILQRSIDLFEYELAYKFGKMYPIFYLAYKTAISSIFYKLREENINFPYQGDRPLVANSFNITFNFIF